MSDSSAFAPRLPIPGAAMTPVGDVPGVTAEIRDGFGLATVLARKGASEALSRRVYERFALELPAGPRRTSASEAAFAGTGPGAWLAMAERGGNEFAAKLARDLEGAASVSDQSDGYLLIRLSGPRAREALAKLIPIDLHPRAFKVGDVASTVAAHIGATLWRLSDDRHSAPVFEVIMFRSLARSFWHALTEASAEFGFAARVLP
jgi:heterotetrameric sarcosine oxidase gamma subunit